MARGIGVIIPAAGAGIRLGGISKPLIEVGGTPLISRTLDLFQALHDVKKICLAVPSNSISVFQDIVRTMKLNSLVDIVEGGRTRSLSVRNAYERLKGSLNRDDLVCIHDAARPLLAKSDLDSVIEAGWTHGAAFLATRVKDTLKLVGEDQFCEKTLDRSNIYGAQTPQVMLSALLSQAYDTFTEISEFTDETMLLERIGRKAFVVESRNVNIKLTTPEDLELIKRIIT